MLQDLWVGPVSHFRILTLAKPRGMTNDICQYFRLDLVNIYVFAYFYSNIP